MMRLLQFLYCIYALVLFAILMLMVLPFVIIFSITGKIKGGNLVYMACRAWARTWYFLIGIHHKEIYEAPHNNSTAYIFTPSHASYMDIPPAVCSIHQPVRALGKYEMVKFPVFGIIYRAAVVLVDRSSPEKRAKSVRALKAALNHGLSIVIFPEGTFNMTTEPLKEFYDGAFRIAIETQTPIKPILFVDALDRMHWRGFFQLTPGICRTVYLEEVPVHNYTIKDLPQLKQKVYEMMEDCLRRYRKYPTAL
mgnify:CR=1 FL=1